MYGKWEKKYCKNLRERPIKGIVFIMSLDPDSKKWLTQRLGHSVKFDEPMSKHTYFRIGGSADAFIAPQSRKDLVEIIDWAKQRMLPCMVIGDGTNLLVKDNGIRGLVIVLAQCLNKITQIQTAKNEMTVTAKAGARLQALCTYAIKSGLGGMNFAIGIPGTVGGGIKMNAGTPYGSMEGVLSSVTVMLPQGRELRIDSQMLDFKYRDLSWGKAISTKHQDQIIVTEGSFHLRLADSADLQREAEKFLNKRTRNQPTRFPSAGCFFKNPPDDKTAGQLIELAGLKGKKIGGAEVSSRHANFIINSGKASAADVLALMEFVQETVSKTFNIELEPEAKIIGN
jgi:UDP-N-acetylmuramate dehydrogenase